MAEKQGVEAFSPPTYTVSAVAQGKPVSRSKVSKKIAIGVTAAVTVILLASIIMGVAYFYRSSDMLNEVAKMYHTSEKDGQKSLNQDIEIDTNNNIVIVYLNGDGIEPGTFALLDYTRSLTGIYDTKARKCYLIGGIQQEFLDPQDFKDRLEKNITQPSTSGKTLRYKLSESYPVSDKSFLPSALKKACAYVPVNWLEPDVTSTSSSGIQKRGCYKICAKVWRVTVCYERCS